MLELGQPPLLDVPEQEQVLVRSEQQLEEEVYVPKRERVLVQWKQQLEEEVAVAVDRTKWADRWHRPHSQFPPCSESVSSSDGLRIGRTASFSCTECRPLLLCPSHMLTLHLCNEGTGCRNTFPMDV